ncbi:MAG TPA: GNAT family N-acetyltransferase [Gaiellaceae bacterium]
MGERTDARAAGRADRGEPARRRPLQGRPPGRLRPRGRLLWRGLRLPRGLYVLDECRGRGLGVELVRELVENGPYSERRWMLHTRDAHTLYEKLGFGPNERAMERNIPEL